MHRLLLGELFKQGHFQRSNVRIHATPHNLLKTELSKLSQKLTDASATHRHGDWYFRAPGVDYVCGRIPSAAIQVLQKISVSKLATTAPITASLATLNLTPYA